MAEFLGIAKLLGSSGGVTTTDDGEGSVLGGIGTCLADSLGTGLEIIIFEDSHRSVPENGLSVLDDVGIELDGLWTDVGTFEIIREVDTVVFQRLDFLGLGREVIEIQTLGKDIIDRKNDFSGFIALLGIFKLIIFAKGLSDLVSEDSLLEGR